MTPWIRTTTIYAGSGRGDYKMPEIVDEILVGFESGNAEKTFMLGALYNGAEVSGFHTAGNDLKVERTRSGIEGLANDAEGSYKRSTPDGNFLHFDGQGNATLNVPKDLNINVGQNFNINVGQNVSFLVGLRAIYNIGVQMMMNTPILKYFVADNYHLQSPKTLINGDGEIKIEAKETHVATTQKLLMHSDESAVMNSKGTMNLHGQNGTHQDNKGKKYKYVPVYIDERCLVNFRPKNDWNGKGYGFDWVRVGDTKIAGDTYYGSIMGKYGAIYGSQPGAVMTKDKNEFVKLMSLFNPHTYIKKTKKGKNIKLNYCVPWLSLYPQTIVKRIKQPNGKIVPTELKSTYKNTYATLRVIIDIKKKPEKLELEYDDKLFSITHKPFPLAVGKHEIEVTITCLKEFATDQPIKVIATYKDAQGKEEKSLAGKLKVAKNKNRYKINVVFIQVWTDIGNGLKKGQPTGRDTLLKQYMNHAYINPHIEKPLTLKLDTDVDPVTKQRHNRKTRFNSIAGVVPTYSGNEIADGAIDPIYLFLNEEFYKKYDKKKYNSFYKVYFINESNGTIAGIGRDIPKSNDIRTIIIYSEGFKINTIAHEVSHSMGVYHSFDNDGEFTFEYKKTDNMMDYRKGTADLRFSTYHWQWKLLQKRGLKE